MSPATAAPDPDEEAGSDLWRALASPWRRELLDCLRRRPQTTGELAAALPQLSRFAVMQHLDVLTEAGVVLVERRGRHRLNHLNPVPLRTWYERWVQPLADSSAAELLALQRAIEQTGDQTMTTPTVTTPTVTTPTVTTPTTEQTRTVRIACELTFRTTAERLFHALSQESLAWFPHTYGGDRTKAVILEPRVGGNHYEDWGDGAGHFYGQVTSYDPPNRYSTRGRIMPGTILDAEYEISVDGDRATLRMTKVATGPMTEEEAASIGQYGDISRFGEAIRAIVERDSAT